jgi:hypothetical protein
MIDLPHHAKHARCPQRNCPVDPHSLLFARPGNREPEDEVDNDGPQQRERQEGGAVSVVEAGLPAPTDARSAPVEGEEGVEHGAHGDEREDARADLPDAVAKVEQPDGEPAQDDGEVEPAEERALVGEEDLGFHARGQGDPLACMGVSFKREVRAVVKQLTEPGFGTYPGLSEGGVGTT